MTGRNRLWPEGWKAGRATAAFAIATAFAAPAAAQAEDEQAISVQELKAMVANLVDGRPASSIIRQGDNHMVLTVRRVAPGEAEVHERMNDLFIVQEGAAQVVVGGSLTGAKNTFPGEWFGGEIAGGHVQKLEAGDILWIPAGMPHRVMPDPVKHVRYLVVKIAKSGERETAEGQVPSKFP